MASAHWYETDEGKARLAVELEAIERFNRNRREDLRIVGGRLGRSKHLLVQFAFQPLATQPLVVRGEMILSSRHPLLEPAVRIESPALVDGKHLIHGGALRAIALDRTIPASWADKGPVLCMFDHSDPRNAWNPSMTVVSAVLNTQAWFLNYWVWKTTQRWPFEAA